MINPRANDDNSNDDDDDVVYLYTNMAPQEYKPEEQHMIMSVYHGIVESRAALDDNLKSRRKKDEFIKENRTKIINTIENLSADRLKVVEQILLDYMSITDTDK